MNNNYDAIHNPRLSFRYMGEVESLSKIPIKDLCVGDIYSCKASEYIYLGKGPDEEWLKVSDIGPLNERYL